MLIGPYFDGVSRTKLCTRTRHIARYEIAEGFDEETNAAYDGSVKKIRTGFKERLRTLCPLVLDANHLAVKRVLGEEVTCGALFA
jgi:hypothetical protein